jgi:hypothetical protein
VKLARADGHGAPRHHLRVQLSDVDRFRSGARRSFIPAENAAGDAADLRYWQGDRWHRYVAST